MWWIKGEDILVYLKFPHDSHQVRGVAPFGYKTHGALSPATAFAPAWDTAVYQLMLWKELAWTSASGSNTAIVGHIRVNECTFLNKSPGHAFSWHLGLS